MFMNFSLSMELQRAWRRLVRAPAFSISVIVLMALGIGGMTAVATAGWSLFLRPLPYQQAEQLVNITVWQKRAGYHMGLSAALVEELNREQSFGTIGIVERPFQLRLAGGTGVRAGRIDHRLLPVLRISPLAGRVLNENDVIPGADPVALISRRFWLEHFGGEASAIGRMLELEYGQVRIAGVLPDRFALPEATTDIWLPMDLGPERLSPTNYSTLWSHTVVARMPEAQERGQYRARVLARLGETELLSSRAYPDRIEMQVRPLRTVWSGGQGNGLLILGVATAVVLIATWLNLAGLWLARWTGRTHELAIQFALGARSGAATTGIVLEYLALGIPGLLLAVGVAGLGIEMLYSLGVLNESGPLRVGSSLPSLVIGGGLLATGLVPLLLSIHWTLRRVARGSAGNLGGKGAGIRGGGAGMRRLLMIGQIGIAFSLLLVLALLLTSWMRLLNEDPGFDRERLVMAMVLPADPASRASTDAEVASAVERLGALPGVQGVAWADSIPFGNLEFVSGFAVDEGPDEAVPARAHAVSQEFFQVAGIQVLSGRAFGPEDAGQGVRHVIVDSVFEQRYLGGAALGRRIGYPIPDLVVVGVVNPVRNNAPNQALDEPTAYTFSAEPAAQIQLLLRTSLNPESLVFSVRETLAQHVGPERVTDVAGLQSRIRQSVADREPQLILIAMFAGLALVLVFYGLYALQNYQVAARIVEIGVRRAMGASAARILGGELIRASRMLPPSLLFGALGAWLGAKLIADDLYKAELADPGLWLVTGAAITLTIALASLVPARRASRVEPMEALRHE